MKFEGIRARPMRLRSLRPPDKDRQYLLATCYHFMRKG
jgi:hypothetical protein